MIWAIGGITLILVVGVLAISNSRKDGAGADRGPGGAYQFLESKTESTGYRNVMDLYSLSGPLGVEELKKLCRERKSDFRGKAFYYLVVFNDASKAGFPNNPFTGGFGLDESKARHIVAIYEFNRMNGYSKLRYHPENTFEHVPKELDI